MCNCGNKRAKLSHKKINQDHASKDMMPPKVWENINFKYTGETALTVIGRTTGKRYRFQSKGDIQPIDFRDANAMMAVRVLEKVTRVNY